MLIMLEGRRNFENRSLVHRWLYLSTGESPETSLAIPHQHCCVMWFEVKGAGFVATNHVRIQQEC